MPFFDGSGPNGMGPMTGRGMGDCRTGTRADGFVGYGRGYGMRRGFSHGYGRGFGFRRGFGYRYVNEPVYANNYAVDEKELLLQQKRLLEEDLKSISQALEKFDDKNQDK